MQLSTVTYVEGDTLPDCTADDWLDSAGAIVDFATGYTFVLTCYRNGVLQFTKSTGITGAATSPNLTINWAAAAEIGSLDPGTYLVRITATSSSETRSAKVTLIIEDGTR